MANWINIPEEDFKKVYNSGHNATWEANGKAYVALQYDADSVSPTSVELRFVLKKDYSGELWDTFHVLLNPNETSRTLHKLKTVYTRWSDQGKWPYYSSTTFTITKDALDSEFTIPEFWICDDGYNVSGYPDNLTAALIYNNYKDGGTGGRGSGSASWPYRTVVGATTLAVNSTVTVATAGTAPTISVKDKGNNTVVISGSLGKNGTHNTIQSATIYYTTDGTDPTAGGLRQYIELSASSGASYSKTISITKACTVKAYIECEFEHNTTSASGSVAAKYYATPSRPGIPVISYTKSRLTIREPWTYTWTAASAGNSISPVVGYRIRLYKNGVNICIKETADKALSEKVFIGSDVDYRYDSESTDTSIVIDPVLHGFVPGDTVMLGIYAYAKSSDGGKLFNGGGYARDQVNSDISTVQNAGIVDVKVAGSWKEGQVYIKVAGVWEEAETVSTKIAGSWKESQ